MTTSELLTARAVVWAWLARAFAYPDDAWVQVFHEPGERARLARAASMADPSGALIGDLERAWAAFDGSADPTPGLEAEHTFLFGRHVRVPPYESSYVLEPGTDRSTHLAEVGGLYAAFGLRVSAVSPEMPDHLGAECELVAALLAKEAYALARGWPSRARISRQARWKLVVEHLQRWLPAFAERLEKHHRLPHYPVLAAVMSRLLGLEERELDAPRPRSTDVGAGVGVA